MKLAILCLCLASTACAVPLQYLPKFTGSRSRLPGPPAQITNPFTAGFPQPGVAGAYSVEIIYPHTFPGAAGGTNPAQPFPTYGFIKYSIPQPPGRQSVEVFYPYDFTRRMIVPQIPPMTNVPPVPDVMPFEFPPQSIPQQPLNIPSFDANALPSQDPPQPLQQDQPTQTSQMPAKV